MVRQGSAKPSSTSSNLVVTSKRFPNVKAFGNLFVLLHPPLPRVTIAVSCAERSVCHARSNHRDPHHPDPRYAGAVSERRRPQDRRAVREAGHRDAGGPALPLSAQIYGFFKALLHCRGTLRHRVRREGRGVRQARRAHPARRAADGADHGRGRCFQPGDHLVQ